MLKHRAQVSEGVAVSAAVFIQNRVARCKHKYIWVMRAEQPCSGGSLPELTSPVSQVVLLGLANHYKKIAKLLLIPEVTNIATKASRQILHLSMIMLLKLR